MANASKDTALKIVSHLEERMAGFRRSAGALKRAQFNALLEDVARIVDGEPVQWEPKAPKDDDEEAES